MASLKTNDNSFILLTTKVTKISDKNIPQKLAGLTKTLKLDLIHRMANQFTQMNSIKVKIENITSLTTRVKDLKQTVKSHLTQIS